VFDLQTRVDIKTLLGVIFWVVSREWRSLTTIQTTFGKMVLGSYVWSMFSDVKFRVFVLLTNNGKTVKAFLRTELVNFDCYLAVVLGEGKGGYALTMSLFKSSQALAGGNFPDPNLSSLRSGSQHLAVPGKR
jgi:hypothetical protein